MMMIKKMLLGVLILSGLIARSQVIPPYVSPNKDWVKYNSQHSAALGSSPNALDANGNVYSTGYFGLTTSADLVVFKYDSLGVQQYTVPYDNGGYDCGTAIKIDLAGYAYVAGTSMGSPTGLDYVVMKISPTGSIAWTKRFDGGFNNGDEASAICTDANGDVYVTGKSQGSGGGYYNIVTLKLDGNTGNIVWQHTFSGSSGLDDIGTGIVLSANGQYAYVTGNTTNSSTGSDIVTYAIDLSSGSNYWSSPTISNGSANSTDKSNAIILLGNDVVITGEITNSGTGLDYTTIRYDGSTGSIVWQQDYDASGVSNRATALARDSTGNVGVVGTVLNGSIYQYHTVLYTNSGTQYAVNIESTNLGTSLTDPKICNDTIAHHWYVCGQILRTSKDMFVYQVTPTGNTSWREYIDGQNSDVDLATAIAVNGVGVVYVGGQSKNSSANYDYTTVKINQTPVYFPPDPSGEAYNINKLYYKNAGQLIDNTDTLVPQVLFYNNTTGPAYYIQSDRTSYAFSKTDTSASTLDTLERIDVQYLGCNALAEVHEFEAVDRKVNYFLPHCGTNGITNIAGNKRLFVPNIYPGIDLHYYSNDNGIKYFFVLKPNADLKALTLAIGGAQSTGLSSGHLMLNGVLDTVDVGTVSGYQAIYLGGTSYTTVPASVSWNAYGSDKYGVSAPTYTPAFPLVVSIAVATNTVATTSGVQQNMNYSTFYGTGGNDNLTAIKVDDNTNKRYAVGSTTSQYFPKVQSAFLFGGSTDAVLVKWSATDSVKYSTFYGGSGADAGTGVAVKSNGNIYLVGNTNSTNLTIKTVNRPAANQQSVNAQCVGTCTPVLDEGFILELSDNPVSGVSHKWSRYLGGILHDYINDVAMDKHDNLYMVGRSCSCDYPLKNPYKNNLNLCQFGKNYDMVITKMDSTCKLVYSTFFGGDNVPSFPPPGANQFNMDIAVSCDVDSLGDLYVVGSILESSDISPINNTSNLTSTSIYSSVYDGKGGVLLKLSAPSNTPTVKIFTEIGTNSSVNDVKVRPDQSVILCGVTSDSVTSFPLKTKSGAYNRTIPNGSLRGYLCLLDKDMTNLWTTHFDKRTSSSSLSLDRLAVGTDGSFFVAGNITGDSLTFASSPPSGVYTKNSSVGLNQEAFISYFTNTEQLKHSHYLGGWGNDWGNDIDVYQSSALYIVGQTTTSDFPIASTPANAALIDPTFNGNNDGYVTRFDLSTIIVSLKEVKQNNFLSITAFPNPVSTDFYINMSEIQSKKNTKLDVYDMTGRLIYSNNFHNFSEDLLKVNSSNWTNGLYIINVTTDNIRYTAKVIKD